MITLSSIAGLLAGFVHALSGPDHLAAIAPLAADSDRRAWVIGLRWGIGHSIGAIIVGFLALFLQNSLHINIVSSFSEKIVGLMLIGVGLWGYNKACRIHIHDHEHAHDDSGHAHAHAHSLMQNHDDKPAHIHTHAALAMGAFHGLAGGAHIFGVLPALAMPSTIDAVFYLIFFGAGTITAMAGFASVMGIASKKMHAKGEAGYKIMMKSFSTAAIMVGVVWLAI
ncbi:Nickel transporter UreH [hydrothermal vent metagenome]|uniref:Nickel transporter UreH n=1 Tax=hydrothermal vent metagenome TaxID=652676 RepID=A0A3B1CRT1_9ZZZZ